MSRDDAVRAAAEAICLDGFETCFATDAHVRVAAAAVDAAAPHLTADLVRERDAFRDGYERATSTATERLRELGEAVAGRQADRERAAVALLNEQLLTADAVCRAEKAERERDEARDAAERMRVELADYVDSNQTWREVGARVVAAVGVDSLVRVPAEIERLRKAEAAIGRVEALLSDQWVDEPPTPLYPLGRRIYRWPGALRDELLAALRGDQP